MNSFVLIGVLVVLTCLVSGCSEELIFLDGDSSYYSSSCPNNAWCEEHLYTNSTVNLDYLYTNDTIRMEFT